MMEFRIRWPIVAAESVVVPVLAGLIAVVLVRNTPIAIAVVGVIVIIVTALRGARVRRRLLQVNGTGLHVQRDKYALDVAWDSAIGIHQRRMLLGLIRVDDLTFSESTVVATDSRGRPAAVPHKLASHPGRTRVQINFYDQGWRSGAIGNELRLRGIPV
jgi:hypothetical protein